MMFSFLHAPYRGRRARGGGRNSCVVTSFASYALEGREGVMRRGRPVECVEAGRGDHSPTLCFALASARQQVEAVLRVG